MTRPPLALSADLSGVKLTKLKHSHDLPVT